MFKSSFPHLFRISVYFCPTSEILSAHTFKLFINSRKKKNALLYFRTCQNLNFADMFGKPCFYCRSYQYLFFYFTVNGFNWERGQSQSLTLPGILVSFSSLFWCLSPLYLSVLPLFSTLFLITRLQ